MSIKDPNCAYCAHGELLDKFGIYICDLTQTRLYLFKEQSHPGRVILANKDHVGCITDLSDEERNAFFADVAHVTRALKAAFHPGRINYGAYNDKGVHLHYHLVPKYEGEFEWGDVFAMNPGRVTLSDEEYAAMIAKIKAAL